MSNFKVNNDTEFEVIGHRVLVKPYLQDEVSEGGIYLAVGDTFERERGATQIGEIVGIGENAWLEFKSLNADGKLGPGKPWAKIGDVVYYAKYAGKEIRVDGKVKYVLINDEDVQCKIHNRGDK